MTTFLAVLQAFRTFPRSSSSWTPLLPAEPCCPFPRALPLPEPFPRPLPDFPKPLEFSSNSMLDHSPSSRRQKNFSKSSSKGSDSTPLWNSLGLLLLEIVVVPIFIHISCSRAFPPRDSARSNMGFQFFFIPFAQHLQLTFPYFQLLELLSHTNRFGGCQPLLAFLFQEIGSSSQAFLSLGGIVVCIPLLLGASLQSYLVLGPKLWLLHLGEAAMQGQGSCIRIFRSICSCLYFVFEGQSAQLFQAVLGELGLGLSSFSKLSLSRLWRRRLFQALLHHSFHHLFWWHQSNFSNYTIKTHRCQQRHHSCKPKGLQSETSCLGTK